MSHSVTLSAMISPVQAFAIEALASGATVTAAAGAAGVARETVSRWVHHDPVFIAELHNIQAEMAAQTRLALGMLGMRAVWTLKNALADKIVRPTNLRAACSVLKMLGADRAETLAPTTPQDVHLRLLEHEKEMRERLARLDASAKSSQESGGTAVANSESQDSGESEDAGEWLDDTGVKILSRPHRKLPTSRRSTSWRIPRPTCRSLNRKRIRDRMSPVRSILEANRKTVARM